MLLGRAPFKYIYISYSVSGPLESLISIILGLLVVNFPTRLSFFPTQILDRTKIFLSLWVKRAGSTFSHLDHSL